MKWDFWPLQYPQQFRLAAPQSSQQFVKIDIPGSNGENSIEPDLKALGCTSTRTSRKILQSLVEEPDEFAQGLDMFHLPRRRRHQLLQQPFGVDPAQRMGADAELSGIVGHDHCIADQAMMADGTPDAGLGKWADDVPVEDIDAILSQIAKKRNLIGKPQRFASLQPRQKGGVHLSVFQKGEAASLRT